MKKNLKEMYDNTVSQIKNQIKSIVRGKDSPLTEGEKKGFSGIFINDPDDDGFRITEDGAVIFDVHFSYEIPDEIWEEMISEMPDLPCEVRDIFGYHVYEYDLSTGRFQKLYKIMIGDMSIEMSAYNHQPYDGIREHISNHPELLELHNDNEKMISYALEMFEAIKDTATFDEQPWYDFTTEDYIAALKSEYVRSFRNMIIWFYREKSDRQRRVDDRIIREIDHNELQKLYRDGKLPTDVVFASATPSSFPMIISLDNDRSINCEI